MGMTHSSLANLVHKFRFRKELKRALVFRQIVTALEIHTNAHIVAASRVSKRAGRAGIVASTINARSMAVTSSIVS